ncbi:MAG TPA: DUF4421 family protein [Bacteroidales bacterium]|nr:DUF4421 family protein [Bacteroidales bacterium]
MRTSGKKYLRIPGILLLLFAFLPARPQPSVATDSVVPRIDSNYIADYTNLLTARLYLLDENSSFVFIKEANHQIVYKPNVNFRIGIAGFYKWFGLGVSVKSPLLERNTSKYGTTSSLDLRINAYGNQFAGELFFQSYKGFYISTPVAEDGSFYKVPSMMLWSAGATGYWILNYHRFSIRAAFIQNERQKKSAGSLIISPFFYYYSIQSPGGILPQELINDYQIRNYEILTSGDFYAFGLAPGYTYSFIFLKYFYINAALSPGVYWQHASYNTLAAPNTTLDISFFLNGRLAAGYNNGKWFIGLSVITGFSDIPSLYAGSKFYYNVTQMRLWGGTRFDWFRKKSKKL